MESSVERYSDMARAYKELQHLNEEEYQKLVKVEQVLTSGTLIAKVGGKNLYAPSGGSSVSVIDSLDSTSTTDALSANQGRVLAGLVDDVKTALTNESSTTVASLTPNVFHKWGEVASLTITALGSGETGKLAEYMIEFQSGSTPTTLSLPNDITWVGGDDPAQNISANKTYQISIVNNLGVYAEF